MIVGLGFDARTIQQARIIISRESVALLASLGVAVDADLYFDQAGRAEGG